MGASRRRLPRQFGPQLTCQRLNNASSQAFAERRVKVGGQPNSIIANRDRDRFVVARNELQADHPIRGIGIGVSAGVQDQLVDNQGDKDGTVCGELDFFGCIKLDLAGGNCGFQIFDDLTQIAGQIYVLVVGIVREAIVSAADCHNPGGCFHQSFAQYGITNSISLQVKHARYHLKAVLDTVVDFLEQDLMTIQCSLQFALVLLLLDRHTEDIGSTLQEGDVMLAELTFRSAVDLEHSEWQAIALQNDIHGTADSMLDEQFGSSKSLFIFEVIGNHGLTSLKGVTSRRIQIGPNGRLANHALAPADARANKQPLL